MSGMQPVKGVFIIFSKPHQSGEDEVNSVVFQDVLIRKEPHGLEVQPQGELSLYVYPWHKIDRVKISL